MVHPLWLPGNWRYEHGHGVLETGLLHDVVEDTSATLAESSGKSARRLPAVSTASPA